jgi:MFS family permease
MPAGSRVFLVFGFGYFLSYTLRTVNAVLAPDLVAAFDLAASDLGLMTAVYFIAFAGMQLPLGLLLDRFGPRRVQGVLLLAAVAGALLFAGAGSREHLIIGRALIGIGVSACLMAAMKASVLWFPRERLPLINGGILAFGGLGAMTSATPVEMLLPMVGWRGLFLLFAGLILALVAALWLAVPERRGGRIDETLPAQLRGLRDMFASPFFWRLAPAFAVTQGGFMAMIGLWAGGWLREAAAMERLTVSVHLSAMAAAMAAGFLLAGVTADRLSRRGVPPVLVALAGMGGFTVIEAALVLLPATATAPLWTIASFVGSFGTVTFAVVNQSVPVHLSARGTTSLNLLMFTAAFALQYGFGAMLDLWPLTSTGVHASEAYRAALGAMVALQTASLVWYWVAGLRGFQSRPAE